MAVTKIVHLSPLYFDAHSCLGGAERYPINLAHALLEAAPGRFEVEIVSFEAGPNPPVAESRLLRHRRVLSTVSNLAAKRRVLGPGVSLRLLPAVNHQRSRLTALSWDLPEALAGADLVHIHQAAMRASELGLFLAKQQHIPVLVSDHGSLTSSEGVFDERLELADRVLCYSDYGASLLQTRTPIEVIKGGVDGRSFTPAAAPVVRDRVLCVGRIVPSKGIDRLITALPRDLPLTVCGRPYHQDYFRLLQRLARGKQVSFVCDASDEQLRELYRRSWVNVLGSVYEDCYGNLCPAPELMGLTLLEAMACGTPVVCNRAGAMPEFVEHDKTGFVYDTPEALAEQLRYLADHPTVVEEMGQQARRTVEEQYDLRVVGARLVAVYERLLSSAKEAAA